MGTAARERHIKVTPDIGNDTETLVPTDEFIRNTSQRNESAVYNQAVPYPFAQHVFFATLQRSFLSNYGCYRLSVSLPLSLLHMVVT
jgi:hypothetical protein